MWKIVVTDMTSKGNQSKFPFYKGFFRQIVSRNILVACAQGVYILVCL